MPPSILLITGIYPPDSGGPAKFSFDFASWLSRQKIAVSVQTYSNSTNSNDVSWPINLFSISRSYPLLIRYILMILSIGKRVSSKVSVIAVGAFLETYFSSILFRFSYVAKVPGDIVWERAQNQGKSNLRIEEFQDQKQTLKYKMFRALYSRSLRRAQTVIVPSMGLYELCLKWGVSKTKLKLVYNSVNVEIPLQRSLTPKNYDLITVCRLAPWKGVDELIEYSAKRNKTLLVVGEGPDQRRLMDIAKLLSADVTFKGQVNAKDVQELLMVSRVFVLNSYYEGLPHALVEARISGILSVGRADTGSGEVINDGVDGYLIRPDRPLESTLDLALESVPFAEDMTNLARLDSIRRFNQQDNFKSILNTLKKE